MMNTKFFVRVGVMVVAMGVTLGLLSEPAHGQSESGVSPVAPKVTVRVAETASRNLRLSQSAVPLSGAPGAAGAGRALASADFDEDGVPDLVTGYAAPQGGVVSVRRGNVDAIYPNSPEAKTRRQQGQFTEAAFLAGGGTFPLPEAADLIGAGDFDADGHWDIVAVRTGSDKLYWLRGDGRGNFSAPELIELHGAVTALVTGEMNRADGLTDVAVGFIASDGPRALVFESPEGALRGAPESFKLSAPASALALGQLDDDHTPDLAIASGNEVTIIHGRDRKLSLDAAHRANVKAAQLSRTMVQSAITSIAVGDFAGDGRSELAALMVDGKVRVLERRSDTSGFQASDLMTLNVAEKTSGNAASMRLLATKVSSLPKDDLVIFGGSNDMRIVTTRDADTFDGLGKVTKAGNARMSVAASLPSQSEVTAVLPMRLNTDALKDLVLLNRNSAAPMVIETQSAATFVVNVTGNNDDVNPGDGECKDADGNCSYVAAIQEANARPGGDTINFNIPGGGPHVVNAYYQPANKPVTIDGTTQPGSRVELVVAGYNVPVLFYGGNSVLRGVAAYGDQGAIRLASDGNIVEGNYLGFRADGTKPIGSGSSPATGVQVNLGSNNLIGGTVAPARNVISNCGYPVNVSDSSSVGNIVRGNYIGTNVSGTAALPNSNAFTVAAGDVTIGGTTAGAGNLISGNNSSETIAIYKAALIQGNLIGTTADGTQPFANSGVGIYVSSDPMVTIGGTTPAARNVIAANFIGIFIHSDSAGSSELVQGNFIGTNAAGTGALPNVSHGIALVSPQNVTVGGTATGAGNLISGNGEDGISVGAFSGATRDAIIQGNLIGTDINGVVAIPNTRDGIELAGTTGTVIGGTSVQARNVISGNGEHGLVLGDAGTTPGRIQGNLIGLNIFGTGALGNGQHGINISNFGGHLIGGTEPGAGNIIAFNGGAGIASSRDYLGGAILSNSIFANRGLGLDRSGDGPNPNTNQRYSQTPVITSVNTSGSETVISGNLRTATFGFQGTFTIQFFSNTSPDPSGYGEGQTFIGETTITAGENVAMPFSATITPAVPPGRYVSAVAIGVYDTQNNGVPYTSEFSFNARVAGDATPENTPLRLNVVTPMVGGDTGATTVTIIGEGISQGATVQLRRAGHPDIIGGLVAVAGDGFSIRAIFNLSGMAVGAWDVIVTNADGSTFTIPGGFTVEAGREAHVFVDILGRDVVRPGRPATFTVLYGNRGNTDQYAVPLFVSGIPREAKVTLGFDLLPVEVTPEMSPDLNPNDAPPVIKTATEQVLWLILPIVPGGTTGVYRLTIEVPNNENNFSLKAFASAPLVTAIGGQSFARGNMSRSPGDDPVRLELSDAGQKCLDSLLANSLDCLLSFIPGVDCFKAVVSVGNYVKGFRGSVDKITSSHSIGTTALSGSQLLVGLLSAAVGAGKCLGDAVPPVGFAADVVGCVLSGIGATIDCAPYIYEKLIKPVFSRDPNDKVGAGGASLQHYITGDEQMRYMIFFENKAEATAAAQDVVITDQLDVSKFDLSTFQLGPIAFGDRAVTPPPGLSEWSTDVDLRPANELIVRIIAGLDQATGIVTWRFFSLDPATMQPTEDPLAGFLPPNQEDMEGEGNVLFTIELKPGLPNGTEIRNLARIVFDTNAPIDTPQYLNTIDNSPPASQVEALPATNTSSSFEVKWSGADTGAGVANYTIYVSENGGAFTVWLFHTTGTSAFYQGRPNATYSFYSVAEDGAGNLEAPPGPADATTTTLSGQLLNIATRLRVQTGENVLIGGVIVTGTDPKRVLLRAIGPSLSQFFEGALENPTLDLYQGDTLLASNDNWKDSQRTEIEATTIPPTNDLESAIVRTLLPGNYTAVMSGKDGGTGIGVVEAYDLDQPANSKLANIATRGFVDSGDNVMIGGVIAGGNGGADTRVLIRAIGPSLTNAGITGALQDPTLELRDANGALVRENDNWQADQQGEIEGTTIPPSNAAESAIVATLTPGNYTAIVRGKDNTTGVALVEVYNLQ